VNAIHPPRRVVCSVPPFVRTVWKTTLGVAAGAAAMVLLEEEAVPALARARERRRGADKERGMVRAVSEKLEHLTPHARAVNVTGEHGCVVLTGDVLTEERALLVREAATIDGVDSVVDLMHEHKEPDGIAALVADAPQLPTVPPARRRPLLVRSASPALRLAATAAGLGIAATGFRMRGRRGALGVPLGIAGGVLMAAGIGGTRGAGAFADVTRLRRIVELDASVVVRAPAEDAFAMLRNLENAPRYLRHVHAVARKDARTYEWTIRDGSGEPISWDVEVTTLYFNRRIAWRSKRGARIRMTGDARFERLAPDTTRVFVRLTYALPFGKAGRAVRALFGEDPDVQLAEDLTRFERLVEGGPPLSYGSGFGSRSG
jgi:uncharacterized membrane protein